MRILYDLARKSGWIFFYLFYATLAIYLFLRIFFEELLTPGVLYLFFLVVGLYLGHVLTCKSFKYMSRAKHSKS